MHYINSFFKVMNFKAIFQIMILQLICNILKYKVKLEIYPTFHVTKPKHPFPHKNINRILQQFNGQYSRIHKSINKITWLLFLVYDVQAPRHKFDVFHLFWITTISLLLLLHSLVIVYRILRALFFFFFKMLFWKTLKKMLMNFFLFFYSKWIIKEKTICIEIWIKKRLLCSKNKFGKFLFFCMIFHYMLREYKFTFNWWKL